MLAFATIVFAAQVDKDGDVLLTSPYEAGKSLIKSISAEGFEVGTKASAEIIRDLWVGSDFDQDGNKEIILASYGTAPTGRAYVYEITGNNTAELFFDTGELPGGYSSSTRHVAYSDLDGNGMQELLVSVNAVGSAGGIYVYEYDTVGDSMRAPIQLFSDLAAANRWYVENFYVADVDGDGIQELMVGNNGSTNDYDEFLIYSITSGTFAAGDYVWTEEFKHERTDATFPIGGSPYGAVVADLDGDGNQEVIFAAWDHGAMLIVEADAANTYTVHNYIQTDLDRRDDFAFYDFAPADLDGDGRDELYLSMYDGGALYCITCPAGTELSGMTTANVHKIDALDSSGGVCTQLGDWDMDGKMEIIASGGGSTLTMHEYQGGDPTNSANWKPDSSVTNAFFSGVYGMRFAGDLDGDGFPEIYGANTGASTIAVVAIEPPPPAVFFSEYIEGSSSNKAIEIYNGTGTDIDLSQYTVKLGVNGGAWSSALTMSGTLAADDVFVIANSSAVAAIKDIADITHAVANFNGDDALGLFYGDALIDVFGTYMSDPGSGWDVAGVTNATVDHTLLRKASVAQGNTDWTASAGTGSGDSEWIVLPKDTFDYLGEHPSTIPLELVNAYPSSGTTITVDYNVEVSTVDPANYSLLGTAGVTFTSTTIDPVDASIVILEASAEIMYDLILDTLIDAAVTDTAVFYAGITPIGWTSVTNPDGYIENGYTALFQGYVSANDAYNNVWVNDAEGGEHTGVLIFDYNFDALVAVGDHITFLAERTEYNNLTELVNPVLLSINSSGNDPYGPFVIAGADIDTSIAADTDPAEKWEGQLVKIDSAVVISGPTDYMYLCTDDDSATYFYVGDNVNYQLSDVNLIVGSAYDIVGVVDYDGAHYRINPRGADDIKKYIEPGELDIIEDFTTADDIANWRSDNQGYTARAHLDTVMQLADGGWTFDARRTVTAEPNTFFKATARIKTKGSFSANPTTQYLYFGIDGIGDRDYRVSCVSDDDFTTFTVIGYAINETGSLYIAGQGGGGADTVWVDEYSYQNNYVPGLTTLSTVAEARLVPVGDKVATIGVVTTTTHFGSAGAVFFQDATAGHAVYNYDCAQSVELGDEILAIGTQKDYNGLLEIDPMLDFMVLSKGNEVVPVVITAADMDGEAYEGMLVTILACDTLDTGLDWASTAGSNKGFNLKDSNDSTFYCYIDKDTDIDGSPKPPMWPIDITGIVSDYKGAQLLPRSLADFSPCNQVPTAFEIVSPADSTVISSFDHADIKKIEVGTDSLYALVIKWTKSVDPDGDDISYEVVVLPSGSYEEIVTADTMTYMVLENEKPWVMNGTYDVFVVAADTMGGKTPSDTIAITFDFEAPPEIVYADVVLVDGAPKLYAMFNMPIGAAAAGNFTILDQTTTGASAPTAVDSIAPNAVRITGDLPEDHHIALVYSGITAPDGTISVTDTVNAGKVLIPFSENHPEDAAKIIASFEANVGSFLDPNWSGSTVGTNADATTFAVSDEQAYRGSKSGKMTIVDDPAVEGGWYVRDVYGYPFSYSVSTTSTLMIMVKGTDAEVEMRLSITENPGYEQGPWTRVSITEDDWQVVSFDLQNDDAEGWVNGNGIVEGGTVLIEGIHIRCKEDKDVVLYFDEFTQRPNSNSAPSAVTLLQPSEGYEVTEADVVQDSLIEVKWTKAVDPDGDKVSYEFFVLDAIEDTIVFNFSTGDTAKLIDAPTYEDNGSYKAFVLAKDIWGFFSSSDTISFTVNMPEVGIGDEVGLPKVFALHQNYPNPFNPITTIKYDLPKDAHVRIMIYDLMGRQVRTLVNARQQAGYQTIQWDARDNYGKQVSSGYYLYVMQADKFHKTHKMILLK